MSAFVDSVVDFVRFRLSEVTCRRRKPSRDKMLGVSLGRVGKFSEPKSEIPVQAHRDSKKKTCRDRINGSTNDLDFAALSTDVSDGETTSSQTPSSESQPTDSPPPWRSARFAKAPQTQPTDSPPPWRSARFAKAPHHDVPPGSTAPPGLPAPKCWNARPNQSHQIVKNYQGRPPATMEAIKREVLNDVMGKLGSEDAEILRALFDTTRGAPVSSATGTDLARNGFDTLQRRNRMQPFLEARRCPGSISIGDEKSLRSKLRRMATLDENRIVLVKKISNLGLHSSEILAKHFSRFGSVEEVLVTHTRIDKRTDSGKPRARPANTGFVVFGNIKDAAAAIRNGPEQVVSGVSISVGTYEHKFPNDIRGSKGGEQRDSESQRW